MLTLTVSDNLSYTVMCDIHCMIAIRLKYVMKLIIFFMKQSLRDGVAHLQNLHKHDAILLTRSSGTN
jgi:hypothetical protein